MADDLRNFRSYYYDKVGFRGVEEKKSLDMLINEKPLNLTKISQFCLRFSLPALYREYIWNLLLGVVPRNPETQQYVKYHREQLYEDLHHCLNVISAVNDQTPLPQVLTIMILLDEGEIRLNYEQQLQEPSSLSLLALATTFTQMFPDQRNAYFLLKRFWNLLKEHSSNINFLLEKFIQALKQEDPELHQHLHYISALSSLPFFAWFSQCFAQVLPEKKLKRIWDKVIASRSLKILVNLAVSLFITLRRSILNITCSNKISNFFKELPEDTAECVVNNALESWYQTNSSSVR